MAADPTTLKVSPKTITQITAIKRNGTAITPITYNGMSGSSYSTFTIGDFLSGDNVTFSSEGYSNLDVTIGTSDVVTFTEGFQTIAFYKHAGVTYEIEDEKAREDIATKQDALTTQTAYSAKGSSTKVPQITTNNLGQVTGITEVTITQPTVNNKTITIQKNSTTVDSFTLNQSTDKTINITVPTKTSDITNDSGFLTSHQSIKTLKTDNTTTQTASSSEAIAGSGTINLHKVSKTGSYNDLLDKPTIPTVNNSTITIQKNGTNVDSFTTNQSSNKSINIIVPTTAADVGAVSTTDGVTGVVAGSTADKINVTKNGTTSTITVNNVANAIEAAKVTTQASNTNADAIIFFAKANSSNKEIAYDDDFKYNPNTNKLTVNNIDGKINGDNYINWGGPNLSASMSPSDAGCLDENGHNKAAFFAGKITTEYSTDGGATWTSPYVLTDTEKFGFTTKGSYQVRIGNVGSSGVITAENVANYLARVTISSRNASGSGVFYTSMKKLILNVSTNGATGTSVKIETKTIANYNNNVDSWSTRGTYNVGGWSGYNSIPCNITFGGGTTQTSQIADLRLTLSATGASSTSANNFNVFEMKIIGVTNWGVNSFAYTGHIYDFDKDKNVTFPNKVTASTGGFVGNLTGTADKATKDASGNTITTTYATKSELPTVNNASLVIQKNSSNVATFTANASANVTCNITVPTKVSDLNNDSGFITGITANNVTTALGYTPYNSTNPNGYTSNTGTVRSVQVQAGTGLASSTSTAQNTTLSTTISVASGYKLPTTTEWSGKQDALPTQSGQSGKFLTTDGSTLSWATVSTGTSDYSSLTNKPSINSVTLSGNKTSSDLGLQPALATQTVYSAKGSATKVPQITTNNLGQVTSITEVTITQPTVNNATLTIQKNGTTVSSFTSNASSNVTCNITVPTKVSDLSNDSGFITGITANNVTTALGYTPYNSSNPSGYTTNTGTVTSVRVQAGTGLSSSTSTAQNTTLNTTISIASGYKLPTTTEWNGKQDALPTQSGNSGKFLTTNGSTMSWGTVDALPSQSGNDGKFLTTNGTTASWSNVSVAIDNSSITQNNNNQIQTVGVKDTRSSNTIKTWTGTKAQYDAIATKDANTLYNITDDTDTTLTVLNTLYPVGAIYIGTMDICPLVTLGVGSWELQTSRFLVDKKEPTANDSSWYNLYSDGWCEQGGFATDPGFIEFTYPYNSSNFKFSFNRHYPGATSAGSGSTSTANHNTVARSTQYGSTTGAGAYLAMNDENGCDGDTWIAWGYTSVTSNIKMWRRTS